MSSEFIPDAQLHRVHPERYPDANLHSEYGADIQLHPLYPERYPDANLCPEYGADAQLRPLHPEQYPGLNLPPEYEANTQLGVANQELSAAPRLHRVLVSSMLVVNPRSAVATGLNWISHNSLILFSC